MFTVLKFKKAIAVILYVFYFFNYIYYDLFLKTELLIYCYSKGNKIKYILAFFAE